MEKSKGEILDKALQRAKQHEMESGGCPQCTLAGIFEALDIENDDVFRAATGLADGVGLTGDGHCGALSGGTMAISYLFGRKKEARMSDKKSYIGIRMDKDETEVEDRFPTKWLLALLILVVAMILTILAKNPEIVESLLETILPILAP